MHFVPADRAFICHDCDELQKRDSLVMNVIVKIPAYGRVRRVSVPLCHPCGVLYLESQDHPIDKRKALRST